MADRIKAYIDANQGRFIEELKQFMRFPSVSAQRQHDGDTRACAEWIRGHLQGLGFEARLVDIGGQPIVRASAKGKSSKRVMIYGHYDVQPEDPLGAWQTPPFEPTIREGILYGRGATDDKGQVFTHVKAVETLLKIEGQLPCEVTFLLEGEEESGGDALARYVKQAREELKPDVIVISDSTMYDENTPALTYGLRGIVAFEFTVKGPASDVHSGAYGGAIANPAMVLAHVLADCVAPDGKVLVPHFYDEVAPLEDWERESYRKLRFDDQALARELNIPKLHGEAGYSTLERLWARPTFEVNGLLSGFTGEGAKTVLPAVAMAKVSMRLVPDQDPAKIASLFEAHLKKIAPRTVEVKVTNMHGGKPWMASLDNPYVQAAGRAIEKGFGKTPVFTREGGSIPVVATFQEVLGLPSVLFGVGLPDDRIHAPNEKLDLANFHNGVIAAAFLYNEIAGVGK